jgi:uncharacterized protein involved in exopolysaccharide biosynthesis
MDAQTHIRTDEVSLKEILQLLARGKWWVVGTTVLFTLAAAGAAAVATKTYQATVIISAVTTQPDAGRAGGLGSVVSEFSGLASLAGLSVGNDTRKAESIAVLQSEALTEAFIRDNDLLPVLYAKRWDPQLRRWKATERPPTLWRANAYFKHDIRTVTTDTKTGLVTLTIRWRDPRQAAQWANGLVQLANDYLRKQAIDESERNIVYLKDQAGKTDMVGERQAIYALMENQINNEMLARGSEQYALKVIDPAAVPEGVYSPQATMWTLFGLLAGLLVSFTAAFVRIAWDRA